MFKTTQLLIAFLLTLASIQGWSAEDRTWQSEKGRFQVKYESQLDPIAINRIHSWTVHISDAKGQPVPDAVLTISGGMPEHNHGLATAPDFEAQGNGDYLLQGLRFHMMGYWELELVIVADGVTDTVIIPLEL